MKKSLKIILLIVLLLVVIGAIYLIFVSKSESSLDGKEILKFYSGNPFTATTSSYHNVYYYVYDNKVQIQTKAFSESTGKFIDDIEVKYLEKSIIEKFINDFEYCINNEDYGDESVLFEGNDNMECYCFSYNDKSIYILNNGNSFFEKIEAFVQEINS